MKELTKFQKRLKFENKVASGLITLGGYGVIVSVLLIFFFLVLETLPLFWKTSLEKDFEISGKTPISIGMDDYKELVYQVYENGIISYYNIKQKKNIKYDTLSLSAGEKIISSSSTLERDEIAFCTDSGRIINASILFTQEYRGNSRTIGSKLEKYGDFSGNESGKSLENLSFDKNENGNKFWVWTNDKKNVFIKIFDLEEDSNYTHNLTELTGGTKITASAINAETEVLFLSDENGEIFYFDISDYESPELKSHWKVSNNEITAISFLIGGNAMVLGSKKGEVEVWFQIRNENDDLVFTKTHVFENHNSEITKIVPSQRNRTFITIDKLGELHLNYSTTSATNVKFDNEKKGIKLVEFSPTADVIIVADDNSKIGFFNLQNEHPEVTVNSLFGKIWYEGYSKPEFVWQSTGGSDAFEPKMSLIPLIFGTIKGTFYAMIFSIPIAILGAIYVSQFAPKNLAAIIKPVIEIMAALPSVVIGFLAGLFFSPLFEKNLLLILLLSTAAPILFVVIISLWGLIPEDKRRKFSNTWELIFVFIAMVLVFIIFWGISEPLGTYFFDGNIKNWLYTNFNIGYDQRNSLVVGIALGFAVIPIIFTITEDALSNVPKSLTSASLALGASKWQTVQRVVLPAASGGIFAAIILGLGRAIGETMIVLMATGNTPILDLSLFNGFRAMSATIAVEIPEAPVGGSLYRVLFLTALLLLIFTFIVNSLATYIGDKLRKKYARY